MRHSTKQAIAQLTPPVLLALLKRQLTRWSETPEQLALRREHLLRNKGLLEDEICIRPGLTIKLHPDSRAGFENFCYRKPTMVVEMERFIESTATKHRLLDIGAAHGIFSLVFSAATPTRMAVAVDASPRAFARLLYNIHKNQDLNIIPVECALSDEPGVIRMHYVWEHLVAAGTPAVGATGVSIERTTGDLLCTALQFEPDVIKIDVEGHEVRVLKGLRGTMERCRPLLFLELHPGLVRESGDRLQDLERMMTDLGYRLESMTGVPLCMSVLSSSSEVQRAVLLPT